MLPESVGRLPTSGTAAHHVFRTVIMYYNLCASKCMICINIDTMTLATRPICSQGIRNGRPHRQQLEGPTLNPGAERRTIYEHGAAYCTVQQWVQRKATKDCCIILCTRPLRAPTRRLLHDSLGHMRVDRRAGVGQQ